MRSGRGPARATIVVAAMLAACGLAGATPGAAAVVAPAPASRPSASAPAPPPRIAPVVHRVVQPRAGRGSPATRSLANRTPEIDHDHLVVRLRSLTADLPGRFARAGARVERSIPGTGWTEVATPGRGAARARAALARDPAVAQVGYSYVRHALTLPNDPYWSSRQSSYLSPLRLDRAWDVSQGRGVVVAVVDTGADLTHPDLTGQFVSGYNVLAPWASPLDDNGHGTMVSGIIAAHTNNRRGVVGVAPGARIMPVKVLDANGAGDDPDIAAGVDWAVSHGADVINLSLGGAFDDPVLAAAVQNAIAHDVVVVAAAGNDGAESVGYPAADAGVLAVGATNNSGALTSFSSYGWRIDVVAPGFAVTSTIAGGAESYAAESGTSFSAPIVAGVAALVRAQHPTWTQSQVADRIRSTARDLGTPGVDRAFGHGLVDPLAAVGGPAAAPRPSGRVTADEPNDNLTDATALTTGATRSAQIAPEADQDWYRVALASGWYTIDVPSSAPDYEHEMDPIVRLYNPDHTLAASQELTGGILRFHVPVAGDYFVRVVNMNGSTASYTIRVAPAAAPARLSDPIDVDFGTPARSVAIADVNGDGRNDVVAAFGSTSQIPDTVAVFTQTDARSLGLYAALATDPTSAGGLATGDLDGDGRADLAIPVSNGIDYFENVSQASAPFFIALPKVQQLEIADVDGDGSGDIVAAGTDGVRVLWGPDFAPADATTLTSSALSVAAVHAADVTGHGDGLLDVVVPGVTMYKQRAGQHRVFDAETHNVANGASVAVGDVDGDTKTDVATSVRSSPARVARLLQSGGTLGAAAYSTVAAKPGPLVIADADGDGNRDLVVLHDAAGGLSPSGTVGVVRQTAPGAFAAEQLFADDDTTTSYDARALAVGDYDGDAANDVLVATSFGMTILLQNTDALPHLGAPWIVDSNPAHMDTDVSAPFFDVTLGRDATNVNDTTVQLLDARGESAGAHATYDGNTRTVRVTPPGGLANGAYTVHLSGLTDPSGSMLADDDVAFTVGPPPDETAPQTILHAPPSGYRSTASATLAFTSNESATFSCSLDNAPYAPCTSPVKVSTAAGGHVFRVFARDGAGNEDATPATANWTYRVAVHGYWMVGSGGAVYAFGNAPNYGSAPTSSVVDLEVSPSGYGYWVVDAAGRVYAYGDAHAYGNAPGLAAGDRVTSISRSATGKGYWLFTARGRVYTFGDARFYGDMRAVPLNGPVLDSVATPSGRGYYMVASDGGVFSFGDARFYGSTGGMRLNSPVRSLVPDGDGTGYWLVAIDGGVFAFRAPFRGSMGGVHLNRPVVGMVAFGNGYLMVGSDGGIFNFSNKPFLGSLGGRPPAAPIVSVAAFG